MQVLPPALAQSLLGASRAPTTQMAHPAASAPSDPAQAFLDELKKSPAQRMREAILARMGVTEEQLKAMSPKERRAIEDRIAQEIRDRVRQNLDHPGKGGAVDISV